MSLPPPPPGAGLLPGPGASPRSSQPPDLPPLDYAALTRPSRRWWRLPLSLLLFVGLLIAWVIILSIAAVVLGLLLDGDPTALMDEVVGGSITPGALLFNNILLAGLIPITVVSTWLAQRIRPGYTHSVAGRFRWGWFGQMTLLLLPLWLVYIGLSIWLSPPQEWSPDPRLLAFLLVAWLTTPVQAAGEEYAFRGWITQNVGGLLTLRVLAWVVPTVLSAAFFAVLHTSLDPWILVQLGGFAVAASIMTWRTGGLEAAVALHIVNNMLVMHYALVTGGLESSIVSPETTGTGIDSLYSLVGHALAVALVWWWAKRRRLPHTTTTDPRVPRRPRVPLAPPPAGGPGGPYRPGAGAVPLTPSTPDRPRVR